MSYGWRRLLNTVLLAFCMVAATATTVHAESCGDGADCEPGERTPSALSWIKFTDDQNVIIWNYQLSLDRGGPTSPSKVIWAFFIDALWGMYTAWVGFAIWLVDWTLSFVWLDWLVKPAAVIADALQQVVDQFGAVPTFLTVTAFAGMVWAFRGKWTVGLYEIFMSALVAALAVGIFANPVDLVAGDDGLLVSSRDLGLEVAAGVNGNVTDGEGSADRGSGATQGESGPEPDELREVIVGMLATTFIRTPHQLVNFGEVLDGGACEERYQDTVREGFRDDNEKLRDEIDECNEDAAEIAENPNVGMFISMLALYPTAFFVLLFAIVLCLAVLAACVFALFQAIKLIVALVVALLPGSARGMLWMTVADALMSLATVIATVVFLATYLLFTQAILSSGENPIAAFFIVDLLLLIGIVLFLKIRSRIKSAADRLAQALAKRPGGPAAPSRIPERMSKPSFTDAYHAGKMATNLMRKLTGTGPPATARPNGAPASRTDLAHTSASSGQAPAGGKHPSPGGGRGPGPDGPTTGDRPAPDGPTKPPAESAAKRVEKRLERLDTTSRRARRAGQVVRIGSTVAAAAATGGTSAAVQAGAKTAGVAAAGAGARAAAKKTTAGQNRSRQLRAKLTDAQSSPPTTTPRSPAGNPPRTAQRAPAASQAPATRSPGSSRSTAGPRPSQHSETAQRLQERLSAARRR